MRLIDKDELLSDIERTIEESGCVNHEDEIMDCVWYASDVDAVPVVRCKDCAHGRYDDEGEMYECGYVGLALYNESNHYCSYGAKMEDKPCE